MAVQVERVGRVKIRMRAAAPSRGTGITAGHVLLYLVSGLVGFLIGFQITGPPLARFVLGG